MDNLPAKARAVETALLLARLSPIEPSWSKAKSTLQAAEARTPEALEAALAPALDSITSADARGRCNQCGYPLPN